MYFLWLAVTIILCVIEVSTFNLITIWFAISSLVTCILAFFGVSTTFQIWFFVILAGVLLIATKPLVDKKIKPKSVRTDATKNIGKTAIVTEDITPDKFAGKVTLSGMEWSAVTEDGSSVYTGETVMVKEINGVKLIVEKINETKTEE